MLMSIVLISVIAFDMCAESVQQSLEKKFGKAGGTIPITPSDLFEKRMGVSIAPIAYLSPIHWFSLLLVLVFW